jgi:transposase
VRDTRGKDLLLWQLRAELAQRDATIAQRDATIVLLQTQQELLRTQLEQREAQLAAAQARIAELQALLLRHFKVPPEPPAGTPLPPKAERRRRRKRGAQPGHPGHCRALVPIEQVSRVVALVPTHCARCRQPLHGTDPKPVLHQVVEVPPLSAEVTEFRMHQLPCGDCGAMTREPLPVGVPTSSFGPRLSSMVAVLTGKYRLSKRMVEELLWDFVGVPLSLGSVSNLEQTVSVALAAPVTEAMESVPAAAVVHQDETSWSQQNGKAWLWVAVTTLVTVFQIALSRGNAVCKQMLSKTFSGTLVSDRYASYRWVSDGQRQFCWSHLKNDFLELVQAGGYSARLGQELGAQTRRLFRYWHRVRDQTLPWCELKSKLQPVRREVHMLLEEGAMWHTGKAQSLCKELLLHEPALWRFAEVPGVEPTNNCAERALRHAVLWRRGSFGTQSLGGSLFVQRILTVVATLRQQGRNVLEYLTAVCQAQLNHLPAPSLLPPSPCLAASPTA